MTGSTLRRLFSTDFGDATVEPYPIAFFGGEAGTNELTAPAGGLSIRYELPTASNSRSGGRRHFYNPGTVTSTSVFIDGLSLESFFATFRFKLNCSSSRAAQRNFNLCYFYNAGDTHIGSLLCYLLPSDTNVYLYLWNPNGSVSATLTNVAIDDTDWLNVKLSANPSGMYVEVNGKTVASLAVGWGSDNGPVAYLTGLDCSVSDSTHAFAIDDFVLWNVDPGDMMPSIIRRGATPGTPTSDDFSVIVGSNNYLYHAVKQRSQLNGNISSNQSELFEGGFAVAYASCAQGASPAWAGQRFLTPQRIKSVIVAGSSDQGFVTGSNPSLTINLYGSNSNPASSSDGVLLGTSTITDGTPNYYHVIDATNFLDYFWEYSWIEVVHGTPGTTIAIGQLEWYGPASPEKAGFVNQNYIESSRGIEMSAAGTGAATQTLTVYDPAIADPENGPGYLREFAKVLGVRVYSYGASTDVSSGGGAFDLGLKLAGAMVWKGVTAYSTNSTYQFRSAYFTRSDGISIESLMTTEMGYRKPVSVASAKHTLSEIGTMICYDDNRVYRGNMEESTSAALIVGTAAYSTAQARTGNRSVFDNQNSGGAYFYSVFGLKTNVLYGSLSFRLQATSAPGGNTATGLALLQSNTGSIASIHLHQYADGRFLLQCWHTTSVLVDVSNYMGYSRWNELEFMFKRGEGNEGRIIARLNGWEVADAYITFNAAEPGEFRQLAHGATQGSAGTHGVYFDDIEFDYSRFPGRGTFLNENFEGNNIVNLQRFGGSHSGSSVSNTRAFRSTYSLKIPATSGYTNYTALMEFQSFKRLAVKYRFYLDTTSGTKGFQPIVIHDYSGIFFQIDMVHAGGDWTFSMADPGAIDDATIDDLSFNQWHTFECLVEVGKVYSEVTVRVNEVVIYHNALWKGTSNNLTHAYVGSPGPDTSGYDLYIDDVQISDATWPGFKKPPRAWIDKQWKRTQNKYYDGTTWRPIDMKRHNGVGWGQW